MNINHKEGLAVLKNLDLGSSIAEEDTRLKVAMIETSVFTDLLYDRVDLIPGTKGSGKSSLFRVFVDFLPEELLKHKKVVIAHGVQKHGDVVFHAFKDEFEKLSEDDFVNFWCIYLVSLAQEQFIKGDLYKKFLEQANAEINQFQSACFKAGIPEIEAKKSLLDILGWVLNVAMNRLPKIKHKSSTGDEIEFDFYRDKTKEGEKKRSPQDMLRHVGDIKSSLEGILKKTDLTMWLMVDRLDEIFPRRTPVEARALRGLLRSLRFFSSDRMRVKIFLRDDMLKQVVSGEEGFTALTHIAARQSDTIRWSEDQILSMLIKRIFANDGISHALNVDSDRLNSDSNYREECFYRIFPATVHSGKNQSKTLRWLYSHTQDGNGIVTPRDIIILITKAKQFQQDEFSRSPEGSSPWLIGPKAILYGWEELSKQKKITYLLAEFPQLSKEITKLEGGKTEYTLVDLKKIFGNDWENVINNLSSIGLLGQIKDGSGVVGYHVPFLYRRGLNLKGRT